MLLNNHLVASDRTQARCSDEWYNRVALNYTLLSRGYNSHASGLIGAFGCQDICTGHGSSAFAAPCHVVHRQSQQEFEAAVAVEPSEAGGESGGDSDGGDGEGGDALADRKGSLAKKQKRSKHHKAKGKDKDKKRSRYIRCQFPC